MKRCQNLLRCISFLALSLGCCLTQRAAGSGLLYNGLIFEQGSPSPRQSGYFKLNVSPRGAFSGLLLVGAHRAGFAGRFGPDGAAYVKVKVSTGDYYMTCDIGSCDYHEVRKLYWTLILQTNSAGDQVSGQIVSYIEGGWSASLYGEQAAYNAVSNPAPQAGHYTMALPGTADGLSGPRGYGFAVLTVDNAGNVRLRGALPDSSVITASAILSNDGAWPLFVTLNGGKGALIGWLSFTNSADNELAGDLVWVKLHQSEAIFYRGGFTNVVSPVASRYVRPLQPNPPLSFTNAALTLRGGGLNSDFTTGVVFRTATDLRATDGGGITVRFYLSTGLLWGFASVPGNHIIHVTGVALQKQNIAVGYFLGPSRSGECVIQEAP
jgi:hypothetical protein